MTIDERAADAIRAEMKARADVARAESGYASLSVVA
jgi:hypothetical protein